MNDVNKKMKNFTDSIRKSLLDKNYYAAMSTALIMPDVCSKLESPSKSTNKRYPQWFDEYIGEKYISHVGQDRTRHFFLSGQDAYSLRCSFLHHGEFDITEQRAQEQLTGFEFIEPPEIGTIHMNQFDNTLQLQVDIFCEDICLGVEKWIEKSLNNADINSRAANIMEINLTKRGSNV